MQVPQVCLLSGPTDSVFPHSRTHKKKKTVGFCYIFSFAVATHHLLREIRVNHQNIKEADIYLECSCVRVCVSLVSS